MVYWLPAQEVTIKATKVKDTVQLFKHTNGYSMFLLGILPVTQAGSELLLAGKAEREKNHSEFCRNECLYLH